MNTYTIITKNGNVISDLAMNGTMFVSQSEVTDDMLTAENLERVSIVETDGEGNEHETVMKDAICDSILHWDEGWLFNIREKTEIEKLRAENDMLTECVLEMSEILYA